MSSEQTPCATIPADTALPIRTVVVPDGIEVSDILFLTSLLPCCAQIALPYWAKITGVIRNLTAGDRRIGVMASLVTASGSVAERYTDTVDLEGGERSSFEIKLIESRDRTVEISLVVTQADL